MSDLTVRQIGHAGRITLHREKALNALSLPMIHQIDAALHDWATDPSVTLVIIDAQGERAFCAGGDLHQIYESGVSGDYTYARQFWRDEYRMNARLFNFPKPVVSFMQGLTLGGGVGLGCHASHRIVSADSRIGLPETSIGLIPDVGGTLLLARAPGRLGEYLCATSMRMHAADALHAGFADYLIDQSQWPDLIDVLEKTGDWAQIDDSAQPSPANTFADLQSQIDADFGGETLGDIYRGLTVRQTDFSANALATMAAIDPLASAAGIQLIHRQRGTDDIHRVLEQEYRFAWRALEKGDMLEGIRAMVIEKTRQPAWRHAPTQSGLDMTVSQMLMPLGPNAWTYAPKTEENT